MTEGIIFNIQRFSIHDGPGIRTTVFLKGCPLRCRWCHNPEGIINNIQLILDTKKCTLCGDCINVCPQKAIYFEDKRIKLNDDKCELCGKCTFYCTNNAREIMGKKYSSDEIVKEVIKDKVFYEQSNGGVTLSGGEPLNQIDFTEEVLKKLKDKNIHTVVDTSGAVPLDYYERISQYTDMFLYDLKCMDDELHKKYIGMSNELIIANLKRLSKIHKEIYIRLPIIEGVNASMEHIKAVLNLINDLDSIKQVNLLPYHDLSRDKYRKLGLTYDSGDMSVPSNEKMLEFKTMFENKGYKAEIGG